MNGVRARFLDWRTAPVILVVAATLAAGLFLAPVYGAELSQRSLELSDSQVGATARYTLRFNIPAPEVLGSVSLQFCANDPLIGDPCTPPVGFDSSGAALSGQSGETGFIVLPAGTDANDIVLARVPALTTASSVSYSLDTIINPSTVGPFYARLQTYASGDASGASTDHGGLAMSTSEAVQITTTVPPFLYFCAGVTIGALSCNNASGSYINFGNLASAATASASSQLLAATNAANGYTVTVTGTTMTSGNNVITALTVPDVSRPGLSQFGLNLRANATPSVGQDPTGPGNGSAQMGYNQPDFFTFVSGDALAAASTSDDLRKYTVSYLINIPQSQPIGVYASTLTYTCLANF